MSDERKGGIALIGSMAVLVFVMVLHPTAHDLLAPGKLERVALINATLHGIAIAVLPVLFLGSLSLTRGSLSESAFSFSISSNSRSACSSRSFFSRLARCRAWRTR